MNAHFHLFLIERNQFVTIPEIFLFEMVHSQKGSCILQHYKKVSFMSPRKLEIVNYPHPEELLNKRSELVSKCRHANKCLLNNYKAND